MLIQKGTHVQEVQINKQLGDKERVAAALENDKLKKSSGNASMDQPDLASPFRSDDRNILEECHLFILYSLSFITHSLTPDCPANSPTMAHPPPPIDSLKLDVEV